MTQQRIEWLSTHADDIAFPAVETALKEPDGLLAAGGDLKPERLLSAYQLGIFPWYDDGQPILWWAPDPRCIFLPGDFHAPRRLIRSLRHETAEIRFNTVFDEVITACAGPRRHEQGTWITADMMDAYQTLHAMGWAHSIEIWDKENLVGGLYGLAIGTAFFGESMFSHKKNASKYTLLYLASLLGSGALELLDCQLVSAHLMSLGARTICRKEFGQRLKTTTQPQRQFVFPDFTPIPCSRIATI